MMQLDTRQRAMLERMGIPMGWLKKTEVADVVAAPVLDAVRPPTQRVEQDTTAHTIQTAAETTAKATPKTTPKTIPKTERHSTSTAETTAQPSAQVEPAWNALDWVGLHKACADLYPLPIDKTSCVWGNQSVDEELPRLKIPVMVVMDADYTVQLQQGMGGQIPAVRLLQNMLQALDWQASDVCISSWQRRYGVQSTTTVTEQDAARYDSILQRQAQLLGCQAMLVLDPVAQNRLGAVTSTMQTGVNGLDKINATGLPTWLGLPCIQIHHPSKLLRHPANKSQAWHALCQLADTLSTVGEHT